MNEEGVGGLPEGGESGHVQDPAEPKQVGQDVQTDPNGAGEGTEGVTEPQGGEGTTSDETPKDAAPVDASPPNRAADVGGEPADRWTGDHPENTSSQTTDDTNPSEAAQES